MQFVEGPLIGIAPNDSDHGGAQVRCERGRIGEKCRKAALAFGFDALIAELTQRSDEGGAQQGSLIALACFGVPACSLQDRSQQLQGIAAKGRSYGSAARKSVNLVELRDDVAPDDECGFRPERARKVEVSRHV